MKKKRAVLIITSMIAIVVVTAGMALAYLQATTGTKTNAFSSNKNINIQLREAKWDGYDFNEEAGDGTVAKDATNMGLGVNQAQDYLPGQVIAKNPMVKNNGGKNDVDSYVAIRVKYYSVNDNKEKTQMSYDAFKNAYLVETGISFDSKWENVENTEKENDQIFVYNTILAKGNTTSALFSEVALSEALGANGYLPGFTIEVQAFAIQSAHVSDAKAELVKFVNAN